jgi:hypothetical protein
MDEKVEKSKYLVIESKVDRNIVAVGERRSYRYFGDGINSEVISNILNGGKINWDDKTFKIVEGKLVKFKDTILEPDEYNVVYKGFNENQAEKAYEKRGITK